jgi:hypothetical protein
MIVELSKHCEECEIEEIKRKYPDYKFDEPLGNMPIRRAMVLELKEKWCVNSCDDFESTVCLDHLGLQLKNDKQL